MPRPALPLRPIAASCSKPVFRAAAMAALALVLCAAGEVLAAGKPAPVPAQARPPRVVMEIGQGGFILSASGGKGTLTFNGRRYPFKVGALGVGGFGVSKVTATGEVHNLRRIEDFPGTYFQARAGYAVGEGKGVQWLENSHGVVLKLRSTTKGVALELGADGLVLEMGTIRKQ